MHLIFALYCVILTHHKLSNGTKNSNVQIACFPAHPSVSPPIMEQMKAEDEEAALKRRQGKLEKAKTGIVVEDPQVGSRRVVSKKDRQKRKMQRLMKRALQGGELGERV